jgi:protocatechuate 3,4-dioxygenase beta subunit
MAQRLVVDAGRDASGIDFAIAPTRTATVSGSVLDADGRPFTGSVLLVVSARSGGIPIDSRMASTDANGGFVIRNVPPGDYVVKAPGSMAVSSPSGGRQFGMQYVSVVDVDPPPVNLVLGRGATIEGRLIVDGEPGTNTAGLGVSIAPADADYASSTALPLTIWALEDGKFRASGITGPGRLTITPTPACGGCYLKSALVNGMDAADRPFDFGLREEVFRDVEIVVSDAGASLTGRAIDTRRAPIMAYSVVVFSTNPDLWYSRTRYVKRAVSGADGVYRVTGLPPGDYFVAALHRIAPAPAGETSPELLEQLATQAQRVTLNERDLETLNLRLIRR